MEEKIAIVIPAYKCRFLRQTLDSIVVQTCRSFTVYIGDDASPQNLKEIVSDYADKMNIVYRRFDTNLGGVDLPGHWDRCIALAKEPVVWFFSDDDLMPQDGVERIIKALECYGTRHGMFRFPLAVIDENGKIIHKNPSLQEYPVSGYQYVLLYREGGEMHERGGAAVLVESVVFTEEKMQAMGIPAGTLPIGWWIGFKVTDEDVWEKVKDGTYPMFSIEGEAERVEVEDENTL